MARKQPVARKQSQAKRNKQEADSGTGTNGHDDEVASYEQELAGYLQERIKPGLNRGAIPLLARSIAKEIAHREHPNGASEDAEVEAEQSAEADDQHSAEADSEPAEDDEQAEAVEQADADGEQAEADEEYSAEADEDQAEEDGEYSADGDDEQSAEREAAVAAFEDEMRELQADLGEDWILRFSVHREDAWLTAEKDDGSQRVEAPTAEVLIEAVELLNEAGGRPA